MPFITVDYFAGLSDQDRLRLQQGLAEVVMKEFNAPPSNVRVFTRAINPADVYVASGERETGLPVIRAEFLPGRNLEQKRALVRGLARVAAEVLNVPVDRMRIILFERANDEWARGDLLMIDR